MNIVEKSINSIKVYDNNPRNNDKAVDSVAKSIEDFGFKVPIVIDNDNIIVTGHTRYKASIKLGFEKVPCIIADDLTEEQIKAFRIADNKTSEISSWDMELLNKELKELNDLEINMIDFGFKENELTFDEIIEDDFELDEETIKNKIPATKLGQIYKLGNHRLMCGDSTSIDDVKRLAGSINMDLLITDPPYNINYEGKTKDKLVIKNDNMEENKFIKFLIDSFAAADSVMKPGAAFYIWHSDTESINFRNACKYVKWKLRECLIWNKNHFTLGRQDYQWKHEPCLYGWKDGATHTWNSDRKQSTVIDIDKPFRSELHPTMKPVELFSYQIKNSSIKDENVLDIFGGSGTTLIACEQIGRNCFMMELDPRYIDVIIERWEKFTDKKAELIEEI